MVFAAHHRMHNFGQMVYSETSVLLNDDDFMAELDAAVDGFYESLNDSGIKVLREVKDGACRPCT